MDLRSFFESKFKALGYTLFAAATFLLFLVALYPRDYGSPFDALLRTVIQKIEPNLSADHSLKLEASSLWPYWPPGVTLKNVRVKKGDTVVFAADSASLRLRLLSIFSGMREVSFSINAYGGKISGYAGQNKERYQGSISLNHVALEQVDWLKQSPPLPFKGSLSGSSDYRISMKDLNNGTFKGDFQLKDGVFGPGNLQGFVLPVAIHLNDENNKPLLIQISMDHGKLKPNVKFANADGRLDLKGEISIAPIFRSSMLDLQVTFGISEAIKAQLPSILFDALLKPALGTNDLYTYRITGWMTHPTYQPYKM